MRSSANRLWVHILSGKLLVLLAVVLMGVAIAEKPSMLLLTAAPRGMAATSARLFLGLLIALSVKACVPGIIRRPHVLHRGRWKTLVAFVLMLILLALAYRVLGSRAFSTLRLSDLVAHRAYLTQSIAFTVLWLALLR